MDENRPVVIAFPKMGYFYSKTAFSGMDMLLFCFGRTPVDAHWSDFGCRVQNVRT